MEPDPKAAPADMGEAPVQETSHEKQEHDATFSANVMEVINSMPGVYQ